ncbi:hypothetical protein [Bacillus pacificus]|nr:hypothetical protein [Bacillus pacificus]NRR17648.1 hypothetical protein [Bacillus pacificus]
MYFEELFYHRFKVNGCSMDSGGGFWGTVRKAIRKNERIPKYGIETSCQ